MIRLLTQTENRWLELPRGVKVEVRPRTTALDAASTSEATRRVAEEQREAVAAAEAGQALDPQGYNAANEAVLNGLFFQYQTEALARMGMLRWEGVGDADGNPQPVTPAAVEAFASLPEYASAFRGAYDAATAALVTEGNGSTTTSAGGMAAAGSTAPDATTVPESLESPAAPSAEAVLSS